MHFQNAALTELGLKSVTCPKCLYVQMDYFRVAESSVTKLLFQHVLVSAPKPSEKAASAGQ